MKVLHSKMNLTMTGCEADAVTDPGLNSKDRGGAHRRVDGMGQGLDLSSQAHVDALAAFFIARSKLADEQGNHPGVRGEVALS